MEPHRNWKDLATHEIIDLVTLTGEVTSLIPPLKKTLFCSKHPDKEADLYCDWCKEVICRDCIIRIHRNHQYDLVSESFKKYKEVVTSSLVSVEEQLAALGKAVERVNSQCVAVIDNEKVVTAEIDKSIGRLQGALDARKTELVDQVKQTTQVKLASLMAQRDQLERMIAQRRTCCDFSRESLRTGSQGEILRVTNSLVRQIDDLTKSDNLIDLETVPFAEQANLEFTHSGHELVKMCRKFGRVYCLTVCPEKCRTSGVGIRVATREQAVSLSVEALDSEGSPCTTPEDSWTCELVASDGSSRVRGTVKRRGQNNYDITYQPQCSGKHQLHILVEDRPILNSPFTVTVLPSLNAPAKTIKKLNEPWGVAVQERGEAVVAEYSGRCISIISANGQKKSFGVHGSAEGVAIDGGGNILVCDSTNNQIQKFSAYGTPLKAIGMKGNGPLQFNGPVGIIVHPHTQKVYVAEKVNHRIQVLNSDLTYFKTFGKKGYHSGEFNCPYDLAVDNGGSVYVADRFNNRVQIFSADGQYLRQLGGEKDERNSHLMSDPVSITVDSNDTVYVGELGNGCVSIFTTNGEYIQSFGREGKWSAQRNGLYGIAVGESGAIYVCDKNSDRLYIYS